jgi:hypothetical protein
MKTDSKKTQVKTEYPWTCPVCGASCIGEFPEFDVCKCGWEDDHIQRDDPGYWGGANKMSLNQAREAYAKGEKVI